MRPVRIGVVGLGAFGEAHTRALSQMAEFEVVAVCSRSEDRAKEVADAFGVRRWYTDVRDLAGDPEVEAVDVVTEVARHAETAQIALAAGKHVLVEKPLSARLDETEAVLRLAEERGRILMVGYIERYDPRRATIRERIASGELGEVVSLYGRRNCGHAFLNKPRFQRWPLIIEPGIHTVDMLTWLAGSPVDRVYAVGRSHNAWNITDTWWATLEFASGAVGVIEQVWHVPEEVPADWPHDNYLEVIGRRGTAQMRDPTDAFWTWASGAARSPDFYLSPRVAGQVTGALRNELSYFAHCVTSGQPPTLGTPDEIRHAIRVALAIVESAAQGRPVEVEK
jgi:predicted dehydrogenase